MWFSFTPLHLDTSQHTPSLNCEQDKANDDDVKMTNTGKSDVILHPYTSQHTPDLNCDQDKTTDDDVEK